MYLENAILFLEREAVLFFCTMNEENKSKLKILSGLREGYRVKFWNDNDENCHLVDSETEVLNILRMENKKIVKL